MFGWIRKLLTKEVVVTNRVVEVKHYAILVRGTNSNDERMMYLIFDAKGWQVDMIEESDLAYAFDKYEGLTTVFVGGALQMRQWEFSAKWKRKSKIRLGA